MRYQRILIAAALGASLCAAQTATQLAESGHCREALPQLKAGLTKATDLNARKRIAMDGVRCGMSLNDTDAALEFLRDLNKRFPSDPAVLYLSAHVFSDLSMTASRNLMMSAPTS